jgi:hypothetical protein
MKKIFFVALIALTGVSLFAQNTVDLKLNLEKNKVYRFRATSEQDISQTMNGVQQNTTASSMYVASFKMVESTPDFLVADVRFDTIKTITNAMGKVTTIQSSNEGNISSSDMSDVLSCIMNRLSRNSLYVKMDYAGKVTELINAKMLSGILLKDTASITGAMASVTKAQITGMVSDKALKTMAEMFTANLPGRQVQTGDTWTLTLNSNSGGMLLDIITSYKLDNNIGSNAGITAESNIQPSANATPMNYGGAMINYDGLKGLGKTEMVLDSKTGLVIESSSKTHIAGNLHISVQNNNIELPMEINGESKVIALP